MVGGTLCVKFGSSLEKMDCKTAKLVWNHPHGFVAGVKAHLPGVMEYLEGICKRFVENTPDAFDQEVKRKAGDGPYRVEHREESDLDHMIHDVLGDAAGRMVLEEHFSRMFDCDIRLANVCCKGCSPSLGPLPIEQMVKIQIAAVNTEPPRQ